MEYCFIVNQKIINNNVNTQYDGREEDVEEQVGGEGGKVMGVVLIAVVDDHADEQPDDDQGAGLGKMSEVE